jgi:hypothetical protein
MGGFQLASQRQGAMLWGADWNSPAIGYMVTLAGARQTYRHLYARRVGRELDLVVQSVVSWPSRPSTPSREAGRVERKRGHRCGLHTAGHGL